MAGRRSKYTPELVQRFLTALSSGASQKDAAAYVGVDEDTICRWKNKYTDFADSTQKAQAQARIGAIARIMKAGQEGTWTADAWFLERSDPANWGRKDKITLQYDLSPDQLNRIARMLAEAGVEHPGDALERYANDYVSAASRTDAPDSDTSRE